MKKILSIFTLIFLLTIFCQALSDSQISDILDQVDKLRQKGVENINIIYYWGDGSKDVIPVDEISKPVNHFYEREGDYNIETKLYAEKDGEAKEFPISSDTFKYKKKSIKYDLKVKLPGTITQGQKVKLSADFKIDQPGIQIKKGNSKEELLELIGVSYENTDLKNLKNDIRYQWFIDEENNEFEEGNPAEHTFKIPNGPVKPYYTVKLRISFKYRNVNSDKNVWLPMEIIKDYRIKVTKDPEFILLDYSKIMRIKDGKYSTPLFISLRDNSYYNDKDYYSTTNIFNKPVIYINDKAYPTKFVDVKKHKKNNEFYNEIIYMLNLDNIKVPLSKHKGQSYFSAVIKVSTPNGLYEKKIPILVK